MNKYCSEQDIKIASVSKINRAMSGAYAQSNQINRD